MKLAVVGKVIETAEIKGADRIKQALVVCGDAGKWSGVVGLDIEVGQLVTVLLQVALQFEVVGPGIQGNPMGLKEIEARLFTVRCADDGWSFKVLNLAYKD